MTTENVEHPQGRNKVEHACVARRSVSANVTHGWRILCRGMILSITGRMQGGQATDVDASEALLAFIAVMHTSAHTMDT